MLDNPEGAIRAYCDRTGIEFKPEMLVWSDEDTEYARNQFEKWNGFHDDAIKSSSLKARTHKQVSRLMKITPPKISAAYLLHDPQQKEVTVESENKDWAEKYGPEAAKVIRATVDANVPHYEYLKQFCLRV
jgi:hypothetical protein